jgi:hypothetical protein
MRVTPGLRFAVAVPVKVLRTWQRKWRDLQHELQTLENTYAGKVLNVDELTRQVESFFKTCRELADWIQEATGRPAIAYVKSQPALDLCDAVAQTAKHYTRDPSRGRDSDPITAIVVQLYGDETVIHADIEWTKESGADGVVDALDLARRCRDEWREFFQMHDLDPTS